MPVDNFRLTVNLTSKYSKLLVCEISMPLINYNEKYFTSCAVLLYLG